MIPDTSQARAAILRRIRQAQGHADPAEGSPADQARSKQRDHYLEQHPRGIAPGIVGDLLEHFLAQAQRMASTVERVPSLDAVPEAVLRYLAARGLDQRVVAWPALRALDFESLPVQHPELRIEYRPPGGDDQVTLTGAFAAIAETGTLMLLSSPNTPAAAHLLPETHIAIVLADRVVAHYEDGFALLRAEHGEVPRAINLVSGPSRTADIEQTLVMGAHGPYRVHIILVG